MMNYDADTVLQDSRIKEQKRLLKRRKRLKLLFSVISALLIISTTVLGLIRGS